MESVLFSCEFCTYDNLYNPEIHKIGELACCKICNSSIPVVINESTHHEGIAADAEHSMSSFHGSNAKDNARHYQNTAAAAGHRMSPFYKDIDEGISEGISTHHGGNARLYQNTAAAAGHRMSPFYKDIGDSYTKALDPIYENTWFCGCEQGKNLLTKKFCGLCSRKRTECYPSPMVDHNNTYWLCECVELKNGKCIFKKQIMDLQYHSECNTQRDEKVRY